MNGENEAKRARVEGRADEGTVSQSRVVCEDLRSEGNVVVAATSAAVTQTTTSGSSKMPYYLANFVAVIECALMGPHADLYRDDEVLTLKTFLTLPVGAQCLFARLFGRKRNWFSVSALVEKYPEIPDLKAAVQELQQTNFVLLHKCIDSSNLTHFLSLLTCAQLHAVTIALGVKSPAKNRDSLLSQIGNFKGTGQRTLFGGNMLFSLIGKEVKNSWCTKLLDSKVEVFERATRLFFLNESHDHTLMALVDMKHVVFPAYTVTPSKLDNYEKALNLESMIASLIDLEKRDEALSMWAQAVTSFTLMPCVHFHISNSAWPILVGDDVESFQREVIECTVVNSSALDKELTAGFPSTCAHSSTTPSFMVVFTPCWVLARILWHAVGFLEKNHLFKQATLTLRVLLLTPYYQHHRGSMWARLSLDIEHLKQPDKSLSLAESSLQDPLVKGSDRLTLQKRVLKLAKPPRRWKTPIFTSLTLREPTHITISGMRDSTAATGRKSHFMHPKVDSIVTVEELALVHYKEHDWEGMHTESSIFHMLAFLLLFDVIFMDVPHVFQTPYQEAPLDFGSQTFYETRKDAIESRLAVIANSPQGRCKLDCMKIAHTSTSAEPVIPATSEVQPVPDGAPPASLDLSVASTTPESCCHLVDEAYQHYGVRCKIDWGRYQKSVINDAVICIGGQALSKIIRLLMQDWSHWGSGMPDLLLYNTTTKRAKLVEVKGPGDKLSDKQEAWIEHLLLFGVDVELCSVTTP
ncbi:fanconi-associated nuclease 1 [Pelomyxa schiedti]|nr:fanconi-associated nuclease 1 [Pelomyxa schiedti]